MQTDEKTLKLINEVRRQKEEIASAENSCWTTNCSFSFDESSKTINLHVESNEQKLLKIAGFLISQERNYTDAAKRLGIDAPPFVWSGFSVGDWLKDIKVRLDKIQITAKKKKLEVLEARLESLISSELRTQMELDEISKLLGG